MLLTFYVNTTGFSNEDDVDNSFLTIGERSELRIKTAATKQDLDDEKIYQNTTAISLVFQSVNFTVNASQFKPVTERINVSISFDFTNGTTDQIFNMSRIKNYTYTFTYTPNSKAPVGNQTVRFIVYNTTSTDPDSETFYEIINTQQTTRDIFFMKNSEVYLSKTQLYRGETLNMDITIQSANNKRWEVSIVDGSFSLVRSLGNNLIETSTAIDSTFGSVNSDYYVKVVVISKSDAQKSATNYYKFRVLNQAPVIDEKSVKLTPNPVLREADCRLDLNVSDVESAVTAITAVMTLESTEGDISTHSMTNNGDGSFYTKFKVNKTEPVGPYRIKIVATDTQGLSDTYVTNLTVQNNAPALEDYTINGKTIDESISVLYGEDLIFKFNVSDIEGISYVGVELQPEQGNTYKLWKEYEQDISFTIRTEDLETGKYYVYVYVTDSDGAKVTLADEYLTAPQEIIILPDYLGTIFPWIALGFGLTLGLLLGIAVGYSYLKRKLLLEAPGVKSKQKPLKKRRSRRKSIKSPKKRPSTPTPKTAKSEAPKEKEKELAATPKKSDSKPKESKKQTERVEKEEDKSSKVPQRRIKRKFK